MESLRSHSFQTTNLQRECSGSALPLLSGDMALVCGKYVGFGARGVEVASQLCPQREALG